MIIRVPLQILAGLIIIFAVRSALSQDLHPGIIGDDNRVRLDERGPPWDAVGQVNVAGFRTGFECTGTLIAPTLVVTAAHCVINPLAQKPYASKDTLSCCGARVGKQGTCNCAVPALPSELPILATG
jgi:V8-like Glu-specific endopeptidase